MNKQMTNTLPDLDKIENAIEQELVDCDNPNSLEYLENKINELIGNDTCSQKKILILAYYDKYIQICEELEIPVHAEIDRKIASCLNT
jgi:hypothetical protein